MVLPTPGTSPSVREMIGAAQGGRSSGARLVVFAVAVTLAVQIGFSIANSVEFEVGHSPEIIGWAAANDYPIYQESFFWLASAPVVAATFFATWGLWLAAGWSLARAGNREPTEVLTGAATSLLWFLILWRGFSNIAALSFRDLILPAVLTAVTLVGLLFHLRSSETKAKDTGTVVDPPETEPGVAGSSRGSDDKAKHPSPPTRRVLAIVRTALVWLIIPIALYMTHCDLVALKRVDLFHDGEFLYPMWEVVHGAVPYRDFYLQHGLFYNAWFPALGSFFTGETYAAAHIIRNLILPLGAVAMYLFGMAVFRGRALPAFLLVMLFTTGISDRFIFTYLAFALALTSMNGQVYYSLLRPPPDRPDTKERRRRMREAVTLVGSGFAAAMAFWHTLDAGVFAVGAIGLFLLIVGLLQPGIVPRRRTAPFVAFAVGVTVGFWMIGVYFLIHGALDDLLRNVYIQSAFHLDIWGKSFPSVFDLLAPLKERGWVEGIPIVVRHEHFKFYWPPLTLLVAVAVLVHRWLGRTFWSSRTCLAALLITIAGFALFRGAIGRSDVRHLDNGAVMAPVLILLVLDLWGTRSWEKIRAAPRQLSTLAPAIANLAIVVSLIIGLGVVMSRDFNTIHRLKKNFRTVRAKKITSPREVTLLPKQGAMTLKTRDLERTSEIARLVEYIKAHTDPGDYVYDFSNQAGLLFLADRRSPTRYFVAVYASPPAIQREVIATLEEKRPALVIFKGGVWPDHFDGVPTRKRLPLIAEYLKQTYGDSETVGKATVLRRTPPPGGVAR